MQGFKEHFCSSVSDGNLWLRDTGMYLLVLYRDQQILYRPQALIWCPETRAARLKFQLCLGGSCWPRRRKSSKSRGRAITSCQYRR